MYYANGLYINEETGYSYPKAKIVKLLSEYKPSGRGEGEGDIEIANGIKYLLSDLTGDPPKALREIVNSLYAKVKFGAWIILHNRFTGTVHQDKIFPCICAAFRYGVAQCHHTTPERLIRRVTDISSNVLYGKTRSLVGMLFTLGIELTPSFYRSALGWMQGMFRPKDENFLTLVSMMVSRGFNPCAENVTRTGCIYSLKARVVYCRQVTLFDRLWYAIKGDMAMSQELLDRFALIESLKKGWDGEEADPVDPELITFCKKIVEKLLTGRLVEGVGDDSSPLSKVCLEPSVGATPSGAIDLVWRDLHLHAILSDYVGGLVLIQTTVNTVNTINTFKIMDAKTFAYAGYSDGDVCYLSTEISEWIERACR